jgi:hypothetical protein
MWFGHNEAATFWWAGKEVRFDDVLPAGVARVGFKA